ncbi:MULTISPECIES: carboxy terminal-processing peptidase [unclassified Capnocytophaga]|jgi:C-terminal peptidase (prc)|uniref:carboxy terminal-processing peptidase n=1 Tax=unclassified Capnocytophaga TaxID=2640652 RepID=UPI000202F4E5|nr:MULTISPECIES: carboxy terminal-processing peptidase [unclassified Capnocytophaga]EGD33636.1 C-terminal processing peptidase [Capnocytophaga sp. oral taxon 338 str. F0234]MEB3004464.1 carboxy terminal-processing peptidase [Capnocytophaga sp. G2]
MKKNIFILFLLGIISFASCSFTDKKFEYTGDREKLLMEIIQYMISRGHYDQQPLDDAYSKRVFKGYLQYLDPQKRYFIQSDINEFKKNETKMDDDLKKMDVSFFTLTYNRLRQRMEEADKLSQELLKESYEFSKKESVDLDYENIPYTKDKKGLRERWRKLIKYSILSNLVIKQKEEQHKKEKDSKYTEKSYKELKKEATETTRKAFEEMFVSYKDLTEEDWFGIYLNSYVEATDSHSSYLAPDIKERFDLDISGKFEGIGAVLQKKSDGIRISDIIMGGPVWKGKLLEVGDLILKVGQGTKDPVDVIGMRLKDAVKLIKGKKGTEVRLTVKRVDGSIQVIPIIRDVVEIEETFAKSALIKDKEHTYGIIDLPSFYINFNDTRERNSASDMALEIAKLKKQNIDGLIVDLRNNGGGSLAKVVEIAGLFIKEGPVVQVRDANGNIQVLRDTDRAIQWDKPLIILINELSASASEILAAAMQDYKRAIILGSKQSYGKGTVQELIDLNREIRNSSLGDLGAIKLTRQKFYRVNGGSTQLKGVNSDIVIPDRYQYIKVGERELENPMSWDEITKADYTPWTENRNFAQAIANSKKRIEANSLFKLIDENARWVQKQRDENTYSLQYDTYKKQVEESEAMIKKFKELTEYKSPLHFSSLPSDEEKAKSNEDVKIRLDRWHENLQKDIYVEEAVSVLDDLLK